MMGFLSYRM